MPLPDNFYCTLRVLMSRRTQDQGYLPVQYRRFISEIAKQMTFDDQQISSSLDGKAVSPRSISLKVKRHFFLHPWQYLSDFRPPCHLSRDASRTRSPHFLTTQLPPTGISEIPSSHVRSRSKSAVWLRDDSIEQGIRESGSRLAMRASHREGGNDRSRTWSLRTAVRLSAIA